MVRLRDNRWLKAEIKEDANGDDNDAYQQA